MPNGATNPLALGANTLRQIGEQINTSIAGLSGQATQTTSNLLRQIASGAPPLPGPLNLGLPAITGLGGNNNPGNSNGNGVLPTPAGIASLLRPLAQLEQQVLPRGVPGPAMTLITATRGLGGAPAPEAAAEVAPPGVRANGTPVTPGLEGVNGAGMRRAAGVQLS